MTFAALLFTAVLGAADTPARLEIYDLSPRLHFDPAEPLQVAQAWDEIHAVTTLQGIVNRVEPRLYIHFLEAHGRKLDELWLSRFSEQGQWLHGVPQHRLENLETLIERFRSEIAGAVVYDPKVPATSNVASAVAGAENLIAIRYDPTPGSLFTRLVRTGPRLSVKVSLLHPDGSSLFTGRGLIPGTAVPSTGSTKCDAYLWMKHHYLDTAKLSPVHAGYYVDAWWMNNPGARLSYGHMLNNHDYWVSKRAWFADLLVWGDETPVDDPAQKPGTDLETLKTLLKTAYARAGGKMIYVGGFPAWELKYTSHDKSGGAHEPVPTEWEYVRLLSAYNAYVDADAGHLAVMPNGSFWQHFPGKKEYPQKWVTSQELTRRGLLTPRGEVNFAGRQFYIFYVGDYDSAGWLYQLGPSIWDHPDRGKLPMMWAVSPIIERRMPHLLDYLRRTASAQDYFVAPDSGAGYLNPGMLQEPRPISNLPSGLNAWAEHCKPIYKRWGLSVTGFIIDGFAPGLNAAGLDAYATFSPNGLVAQWVPPSLLHANTPVMRADRDLPDDANAAAQLLVQRCHVRKLPFHWFRAVIKSPDWYLKVHQQVSKADPKLTLLDAPTFFELYRIYLKHNPDAATGQVPVE